MTPEFGVSRSDFAEPILMTIHPHGCCSGSAARSRFYQLLAMAFSYPSNLQQCEDLLGETMRTRICDAVTELPFAIPISPGHTRADQTSQRPEEIGVLYLSLFDRALDRNAVSMYEHDYVSDTQQTLWEDLIRFYEYFGLDFQNGRTREPSDHLLLELEFLHYLTFLEAGVAGDKMSFVIAQRDFITRHVGKWIPKFCTTVRNIAVSGPYSWLAAMLESFIAADEIYLNEMLNTHTSAPSLTE